MLALLCLPTPGSGPPSFLLQAHGAVSGRSHLPGFHWARVLQPARSEQAALLRSNVALEHKLNSCCLLQPLGEDRGATAQGSPYGAAAEGVKAAPGFITSRNKQVNRRRDFVLTIVCLHLKHWSG